MASSSPPRRLRPGLTVLAAAAAALAAPAPADACLPAVDAGAFGRPTFESAERARVLSEELSADCDDAECSVVAIYRVAVARSTTIRVDVRRAGRVEMSIDGGGDVVVPASGVALPAGARRLVLRARLALGAVDDCFQPGIRARHPLLGTGREAGEAVVVLDTEAPVRVRHPGTWRLVTGAGRIARPWPTSAARGVEVRLARPGSPFLHGGPLLVGGVASGVGGALRIRGGWEVASPSWLVLSLTADSDLSSMATTALVAELTSRAWVLPLSFGVGAGPTVRVEPDVRPGARGQLSVAVGAARLLLSVDLTPPRGDDTSFEADVALLGGLSI